MADSDRNPLLDKRKRAKADISDIEADVAYFDARISMIGNEPDSSYQKAQLKTYQILEKLLQEDLLRKKKALRDQIK